MNLRSLLLLCLLMSGTALPASSQRWTQEDWSEMRHRLEYNLDMKPLFDKHPFWRLSLEARKRAVKEIACGLDVPPSLALALVEQESGFNQSARGEAGELGASQIMPGTARLYELDGERLTLEYRYNVAGGLTILKSLLSQFGERDGIAAYNGGPGFQSSPPRVRKKVQQYVSQVLARKEKYEGVRCE
jgi:soluble lytic murein transglycosylase-like protein